MFDNVKRFISRFTDKPIYKGTGVTTITNDFQGTQTNAEVVTSYRLNGTEFIYSFQRVSVGKKSGIIYYILERKDSNEEMVVGSSVFNEIFTRIAN